MKTLEGLKWAPKWVSQLGCIKGCLVYLDLDVSDAWLFGGTGYAFVLNVHEEVCPSGPTAWNTERVLELGRNLGYRHDGVYAVRSEGGNFTTQQEHAWEFARTAIDRGIPCYAWELEMPEYYVVTGYDGTGYCYSGPGCPDGQGPKPWNELGDTPIGVLEMFSIQRSRPATDEQTAKEALSFALEHATNPGRWIFPQYGAGLKAYDNWIRSLESGSVDGLGMAYNSSVWAECRGFAVLFLREAQQRLDAKLSQLFDEASKLYQAVFDNLQQVSQAFPFFGMKTDHMEDPDRRRVALERLRRARDAEEQGLESLRAIEQAL